MDTLIVVYLGTGEFPIRLVDGDSPYEGRVEVYYQGMWGTVCNKIGWGVAETKVVCRQLGYSPLPEYTSRSRSARGSGPILLDRVSCVGQETTLVQCDHGGWFAHTRSCSHGNDAAVACQPSKSWSLFL